MKNKDKKEVPKDEFRKNKDSSHPAHIYAKIGKDLKFIEITHSPITDNVKNIKLDKNPNPKDARVAYVRPKAEKESANKFSKKLPDWKLSKSDKEKVRTLKK